jgi:hypothetical protein
LRSSSWFILETGSLLLLSVGVDLLQYGLHSEWQFLSPAFFLALGVLLFQCCVCASRMLLLMRVWKNEFFDERVLLLSG